MKKTLLAPLAAAVLMGAAPAHATVLLTAGSLGDPQVHSIGTQSGQTVFGQVDGQSVSFSSTSTLGLTGSGVAFVKHDYTNLDIFLTSYAYGFDSIDFNLFASGVNGHGGVPVLADITAYLVGGGVGGFFDNVALGQGANKFYLSGDQALSRVSFRFYSDAANAHPRTLEHVEQVGFDLASAPPPPPILTPVVSAIPEPATWALMIGGFGLMGAVLRRRRSSLA